MNTYCEECISTLPVRRNLTGDELVRISCDYFSIPVAAIKSKCRIDEFVKPRHMIISFLNSVAGFSGRISANFVNRNDHTTTIHARRSVSEQCFTNRHYKKEYQDYIDYMKSFI